jgi:type IV secretion system protein VirD4
MSESLLSDFLRGDPEQKQPRTPQANFVIEKDVLETPGLQFHEQNEEGKLFLGVIGAAVHKQRLADGRIDRYALGGNAIGVGDDRHIITVAGSRSGKGRAALVPNLITYPGSALVIDPKGDLAKYTARHRAKTLKQKVCVFDPFGAAGNLSKEFPASFNPLSILKIGSSTIVEDAGLIADALIVPSATDPHWDESAKMFVETLVLHAATWPEYEGHRDLLQVSILLSRALRKGMGEKFLVEEELDNNPTEEGAVQNGGRAFYDRSERELESVLSTVRRHLHFLGYRKMKPVLKDAGDASLDLAALKREPMTVYLVLPAMRMGTCSRWLRLFVNLTLAAMENERTPTRYPVLMCLDEFAVLGPMKTIEDAAGQIAGLGCKLWPVLQDLGQLKSLYKDRWETFMGNAGVLQFFGNSDLTTLEWISKRLGQTTVINPGKSDVAYDTRTQAGITGESWSQATQDLMTAEEVSRFFGRDDPYLRQLIIRPTFPPMVLQRAFYDKHGLFRGKYAPD